MARLVRRVAVEAGGHGGHGGGAVLGWRLVGVFEHRDDARGEVALLEAGPAEVLELAVDEDLDLLLDAGIEGDDVAALEAHKLLNGHFGRAEADGDGDADGVELAGDALAVFRAS